MDTENDSDATTHSVERTVGNGCANPDTLRRPKKGRVFCVRRFPVGCGPNKMPSSEKLGTSVQPCSTSSSLNYLEEEEKPMKENDEAELALSVGLQKLGLIKTSPSPHEDLSKLSKADFPVKARVYPPRRKISGVRTFPPGCGGNEAQTNQVATGFVGTPQTGTTGAKDEEEHKEQIMHTGTTGANDETVHKEQIMHTSNAEKSQRDSERLETGNGNPSNKDIGKRPDVKPSTDTVIPGSRTIVMALMAPQNCPWTQKRRVSRPKTAKGRAEAKAIK
ncbi:unnamed protein product [Linum trigynum]|uniref:Uncharacterized protein n=1 Tax=Linum trigynum TaxID=586398 RepID=A0AAV2DQ80_9ROSI